MVDLSQYYDDTKIKGNKATFRLTFPLLSIDKFEHMYYNGHNVGKKGG
ncbi:hypothetical protein B4113_1125 [Geobacillus sp. B4113_201601]|nr:hypothetical protein B4113_1125 [Geobacillus sp. B4113_201601]